MTKAALRLAVHRLIASSISVLICVPIKDYTYAVFHWVNTRPHSHHGDDRCRPLSFELAVELRLCKKSARRLQNLIGPAQLFVLTLELFDALRI